MPRPDIGADQDAFELSPALREYVQLAKDQPVPPVAVAFADVALGVRAQRRRIWWGAAAVLAAVVVAWVAWPRVHAPEVAAPQGDEAAASVAAHTRGEPATGSPATPVVVVNDRTAVGLAEGIRVLPINGDDEDFTVRSARRVELRSDGVFEIETPPGNDGLEVLVGRRVLEVAGDSSLRLDVEQSSFTITRGGARWADDASSAKPKSETDAAAPTEPRAATAAELARRAESEMATGRRGDAIGTLEVLVRRHPRSTAARAGLVDLARLYKAAGKTSRARCAYELHRQRFPKSSLAADVDRALAKLGAGPGCRGLRPR